MCRIVVTVHTCGHFRSQYALCPLITREEIVWIQSTGDQGTIINNCVAFEKKIIKRGDGPCGESCVKANSNGWRCCDCTLRRHPGDMKCSHCGHKFCANTCYALGPDESAKMTAPYDSGITMPMDIQPVKRWSGSADSSLNSKFSWGMNSDSGRSS